MNIGKVILLITLYSLITVIVCVSVINYMLKKDEEELAFLVFPLWVLSSLLVLEINLL